VRVWKEIELPNVEAIWDWLLSILNVILRSRESSQFDDIITMIGKALVLAYSAVTGNDQLIECVLVNLASAVQFHSSTLPVDFIDGCYATAACLPDDLTYYVTPLLLALWSRDRSL
jgi:hypothetical protein